MCKRPGLTQISPSFLASCPPGYSNNGFACQNDTDSYIKQCSIPGGIIYPCKSGFTDMGCYCQLTSGIRTVPFDTNSCPQNTVRIGNRCYPTCPVEYVRQGEECVRPESILDNQSMSCPPGTFRQDTKCYQMCQPEFVFNNGICESPIDISNELTCPATYPKLIGSTCYGSCPLGTEPLGPNETSTSCVTFDK
jgi:hypothetical protein